MENKTRKIVFTAMFAALTCVATMCITIQTPPNGYIHIGDSVVLLCGWMLGPLYGFFAAALGSALADLLAGYAVYAIITFLIKGCMALAAYYIFKIFPKKKTNLPARIISAIAAELIMFLGYYLFDGFLYGFVGFLAAAPGYLLQGGAGIILGVILIKIFEKANLSLRD